MMSLFDRNQLLFFIYSRMIVVKFIIRTVASMPSLSSFRILSIKLLYMCLFFGVNLMPAVFVHVICHLLRIGVV